MADRGDYKEHVCPCGEPLWKCMATLENNCRATDAQKGMWIRSLPSPVLEWIVAYDESGAAC